MAGGSAHGKAPLTDTNSSNVAPWALTAEESHDLWPPAFGSDARNGTGRRRRSMKHNPKEEAPAMLRTAGLGRGRIQHIKKRRGQSCAMLFGLRVRAARFQESAAMRPTASRR